MGEFFIILLYAPLFTAFLKGYSLLWKSGFFSFLNSPDIGKADKVVFPTAVNILLGAPGQFVSQTNSLNLSETFLLYVIALILFWGAIILPWMILRIVTNFTLSFLATEKASENPQAKPPELTKTADTSETQIVDNKQELHENPSIL